MSSFPHSLSFSLILASLSHFVFLSLLPSFIPLPLISQRKREIGCQWTEGLRIPPNHATKRTPSSRAHVPVCFLAQLGWINRPPIPPQQMTPLIPLGSSCPGLPLLPQVSFLHSLHLNFPFRHFLLSLSTFLRDFLPPYFSFITSLSLLPQISIAGLPFLPPSFLSAYLLFL